MADCATLFAQHAVPQAYLPLLHSKIMHDPMNTLTQRQQYVLLLSPLLRGMRQPALIEALPVVFSLLEEEQLVQSQHTPLRHSLQVLLQTLVGLMQDGSLGAEARSKYHPALEVTLRKFNASDPLLATKSVVTAESRATARKIEIEEEEEESTDEEGVVVVMSPTKRITPAVKDEVDEFEDELD